jgi:uncharacterized membrane protein SpoIIM required for sporulation
MPLPSSLVEETAIAIDGVIGLHMGTGLISRMFDSVRPLPGPRSRVWAFDLTGFKYLNIV